MELTVGGVCFNARRCLAGLLTVLVGFLGLSRPAVTQAAATDPIPYQQPSPGSPVRLDAVIDLAGQQSGKPYVVTQLQGDSREEIPQNCPASFFGSYVVTGEPFSAPQRWWEAAPSSQRRTASDPFQRSQFAVAEIRGRRPVNATRPTHRDAIVMEVVQQAPITRSV